MENRKGTGIHIATRPAQIFPVFYFPFSILLLTAGCGAPGDPVPPSPPVPVAIKDLAAHQAGDGVQLSFTLPANSIFGERLPAPPAVEILRGAPKSDGSADSKSFRVVYTIPGALVEGYRADGRVRFIDPIAPEETKSHPGGAVTYVVRTRASQKRASADSNAVSLRLFPVPAPITSVEAHVTESAVELTWPVPARPRSRFLLSSPGPSILKPIWPDIASIEVSRRAVGASSFSPRTCCPRPRFVIRL